MPSKHNTAVTLTEDLKRQAEAIAREETISVSAIVRRALRLYFASVHAAIRTIPDVEPNSRNENSETVT
jgi:hypothetical protein